MKKASRRNQSRCRCGQPATHQTRLYGRSGPYVVVHCSKHALPNSQPLVASDDVESVQKG